MDHWAILLFMDVQPTYPPWPRIPLSNKGLIAGLIKGNQRLIGSYSNNKALSLGWVGWLAMSYSVFAF